MNEPLSRGVGLGGGFLCVRFRLGIRGFGERRIAPEWDAIREVDFGEFWFIASKKKKIRRQSWFSSLDERFDCTFISNQNLNVSDLEI